MAGPPCRWRRCRKNHEMAMMLPTFCMENNPARMALEGARAGLAQKQARKEVARWMGWEVPEGRRRASGPGGAERPAGLGDGPVVPRKANAEQGVVGRRRPGGEEVRA